MKKILLRTFFGVVILIGLLLILGSTTTVGLRTLFRVAALAVPGTLQAAAVNGTLLGQSRFENIHYSWKDVDVTISRVSLEPIPSSLLGFSPKIKEIHIGDLAVSTSDTSGSAHSTHLALPFSLSVAGATMDSLTLSNTGESEPYFVLRQASFTQAAWVQEKVSFTHLDGVYAGVFLELAGEIELWKRFPLQVRVAYSTEVPGIGHLQGSGEVSGDFALLKARSNLEQPVQLNMLGHIDFGQNQPSVWKLDAVGKKVALQDIDTDWPALVLHDFEWNGSGTFKNLQAKVAASAEYDDLLHSAEIQAQLTLDGSGMHVGSYQARQGEGILSGFGNLRWGGGLQWDVFVHGESVDPGYWDARWPGELRGELHIAGAYRQHLLTTEISLDQLNGILRDYPIEASAAMSSRDRVINIQQAYLTSGDTRVAVQGVLDGETDLDFTVHSQNLNELWPGLHGALEVEGNMHGSTQKPVVKIQASGSEISFSGIEVQSLQVQAQGTPFSQEDFTATFHADDIRYQQQHLDTLHCSLQGQGGDSTLHLTVNSPEVKGNIALQGKYLDQSVQGTIQALQLTNERYGSWIISGEPVFQLSPTDMHIDPFCLAGGSQNSICLTAKKTPKDWQVQLQQFHFSSAYAEQVLGRSIPVEGAVRGNGQITGRGAALENARLELSSDKANLKGLTADDAAVFKEVGATGSLIYADRQLQTELDILFQNSNSIHGLLVLRNLDPLHFKQADPQLDGNITLSFADISVMNPVMEAYAVIKGSVLGQLQIGGRLTDPLVHGRLQLENGAADIIPLGITLEPVAVSVEGNARELDIQARASSGKGNVRISSTFSPASAFSEPVEIHLQGEDFEVVRFSFVQADISPDLYFSVSPEELRIRGDVRIPRAVITQSEENTPIRPSKDVAIVDESAQQTADVWPLYAKIRIVAGDDVAINAYGLRGRIKGRLEIDDRPNFPPVGNGTVQVENGTFRLYGKQLDIDIGRLIFTGNPLDNPGLEVHSEKRDNGTTVGVNIGGFLQRPEIRLYSSPYMEQYEILAKLLSSASTSGESGGDTGIIGELADKAGFSQLTDFMRDSKELLHIDDIKVGTGDSFDELSLIIGTWLTPRFYVSYGRDLLKESGSFNTRYTLGKGFYIKMESGTSQSGGDIKYEFVR